jgi:predicted nucleotide-binding protein
MASISDNLLSRLRKSLAECCTTQFSSDQALKVAFTGRSLSDYKDSLPQASNPEERIIFLIDFLGSRKQYGKDVLVTFLEVMSERQPNGDSCKDTLLKLAHELESELGTEVMQPTNEFLKPTETSNPHSPQKEVELMAKRNTLNPEPQNPTLKVSVADAREKLQARIDSGKELKQKISAIQSQEVFSQLQREMYDWSNYNMKLLSLSLFENFNKNEYEMLYIGSASSEPLSHLKESLLGDITYYIDRLSEILNTLELYSVVPTQQPVIAGTPKNVAAKTEIFIVHGHDGEAKHSVARFIERLGFSPIILQEMPNGGRTIIEKFEENSANVGFAIVLLTPDDTAFANKNPKLVQSRARENVIFELGYFNGKLGRSKVCVLTKGGVAILSDYSGVLYIALDDSDGWKLQLAKEMKNAGLAIDSNKVL